MISKYHVEEGLSILDIGCYIGDFLSQVPSSWKKTGIDILPSAIKKARDKNTSGVWHVSKFEDIDLEESGSDIITAWDVLEHIYDIGSTMF